MAEASLFGGYCCGRAIHPHSVIGSRSFQTVAEKLLVYSSPELAHALHVRHTCHQPSMYELFGSLSLHMTNQSHNLGCAVVCRYTQGFAVLDVSGCTNGNAKGTTPELTLLPQTSPLPTGANSKFQLMLAP